MTRRLRTLILAGTLAVAFAAGAGCRSNKHQPPPRNPELARRANKRAVELTEDGKYAEAERLLRKAIAADVMYGPARNNLGLVYYHQGKLYPAAWEFQNAIRLMPYQPEPRNNLGLVFEKAGKMDDAESAYRTAREMEPDNPEYIGNLARTKVRQGERDDETRELLQELVLKDARPAWQDWAKLNLYRFAKPADDTAATTRSTQN